MKKITSSSLALMLAFGAVSPTLAQASESTNASGVQNDDSVSINPTIDQSEMINAVKPYVEVTKEGTIQFKNVPQDIYDKYNLDLLQQHFDELNASVKDESITINKDLSITDNSFSLNAVYGEWTYHWWGYDRKFNNSQAKAFADYCASVSAGAGIITGIGAWFPPVAAIGGVQTGYWALVASRVNANNKGKGVLVSVTWVAIFDVEPL